MAVARKEPKRVSREYIRLYVLNGALFVVSVTFFLDVYWPVQNPASSWVMIPAIVTGGLAAAILVARLTVPALRREALLFRMQMIAWLTARRSAPWVFMAAMGAPLALGLFVTYPVASWVDVSFGWAVHYIGLFALVVSLSLVELAFYNSIMPVWNVRYMPGRKGDARAIQARGGDEDRVTGMRVSPVVRGDLKSLLILLGLVVLFVLSMGSLLAAAAMISLILSGQPPEVALPLAFVYGLLAATFGSLFVGLLYHQVRFLRGKGPEPRA